MKEQSFSSLPTLKEILLAIGREIRSKRMSLGYSQEQFAEKAGCHRTFIGMVERGEQNITLETCYKFASALGMGIYDLIYNAMIDRKS